MSLVKEKINADKQREGCVAHGLPFVYSLKVIEICRMNEISVFSPKKILFLTVKFLKYQAVHRCISQIVESTSLLLFNYQSP